MTPKEKAQELIDKHNVFAIEKEAIQHAIITVEELIQNVFDTDYWIYVHQELEKL